MKFKYVSLKDVCKEIVDCPHKTPVWRDSGIPIIRNFNIKNGKLDTTKQFYVDENTYVERTKRAIPEYDDIVISREAPMGELCLIPKGFKCCLGQRLVLLKINKEICYPKYLLYIMLSEFVQKQIKIIDSTGSIVSNLNIPDLKALKIPLVDMKEQVKIGTLLSFLDEKIDFNNKINTELENMAKTLYDYWFVQFDFPDENKRPYKSANGKMVYNEVLKREIPAGWEVKNIKDLCNVVTGKEDANFATSNGKYAFFTCGDDVLKCDSCAFEGKAVLVAGNGNFNVKYYEGCFNAYQRTYVLIPKNTNYIGVIHKSLIDSIKLFTQGANGSIVKFITKGDIENTKVIIPDNTSLLYPLNLCLSKIDTLKKENMHLAYLRDFLLPLLMNGQVSVQSQL